MFSKRVDVALFPNPISRMLAHKQENRKKVLDLTQSNPTHIGLDYDGQYILAALSRSEVLRYEPNPCGLLSARTAIADVYRQLGAQVASDALYLTASTSDAYSYLFKLLGNPTDQILIPAPGYPLLSYLARFENLESVLYPQRYAPEKGWYLDLDAIEARITTKTRAIVVVNPNNPTGAFIKKHELQGLERVCYRYDMAMIVDEVFSDYYTGIIPEMVRTAAGHRQVLTFVLNGFSKMIALPQVKLAWIAISGPPNQVKAAKKRLEILLDFYLSVSPQVQHGVNTLLGMKHTIQSQLKKRIVLNQRRLTSQLSATSNCRMLNREGGWYAVVEIEDQVDDEQRVIELLSQADTLAHPGYFYEFHRDGFLVLSLLPKAEQFQKGVANIVQCFGRT